MPIVPIPLSGGAYTNIDKQELGSSEKAAEMKNLMLSDSGANIGRPGLSSFATMDVACEAIHEFNNHLFVVGIDRRFYKVTSAGVVSDITGSAGGLGGSARPNFAEDGTLLGVSGGGAPMTWDGTNSVITMVGSAPSTDSLVYLDGYWLAINSSDDIQFAGPTSADRATWSAADFFQAEGLPDSTEALAVLQRELFVFGEDSTEVYQNFGDVSVPFRRVFFIDVGISAKDSLVNESYTLWFLDENRRFSYFNGRTPTPISFPFDKDVQRMSTVSDCFGSRIQIDQHNLIAWTFPTEGRCFVFDSKKAEYVGEWAGFENGIEARFRMNGHVYMRAWDQHFIADYNEPKVWELSTSNYADGSNPRLCLRTSGELDHGTRNRKRNIWYRMTVKRGVATTTVTDPIFEVRFRDDDKDWGNPYQLSLGATGEEATVLELRNTGLYRKREIEIRCTDAVEFSFINMEENVEVLSH
jgi:hypothetical protein